MNQGEQYQIKKEGIGALITFSDKAKIKLYELFPGIIVAFNDIHTDTLPIMRWNETDCLCTINYALQGICGLYTADKKYIYLRANEVMLSSDQAAVEFEYPTGEYIGIEIYIMKNALTERQNLKDFQIDLEYMINLYFSEQNKTVIADNGSLLKNALFDMFDLYQREILDISLLRLHVMYILRGLTAGLIDIRSGYEGALTRGQVEIAKRTKERLVLDLNNKITIAHIAEEEGISATSLKKYFKSVYGKNISEYLRTKRLDNAKEMLEQSKLSILEIANAVGFASQSKFTAVFHKELGITPTEYRRTVKKEER